ncbi:MAG: hypothetical protein ACKOFP_09365, partial [Actinomycetota bacterium]
MALRIHDPGHIALRRGIRAAIGVPIAVGIALILVPNTPGGLIAAFGSLGLIATCDFGGSTRRRFTSLIGAASVGAIVICIGVLAGLTLVSAVLVTLIVGTGLAFSAVLHGSIASGAPAMTVVYVAATTVAVPLDRAWTLLAGWAIAVAVAIPVSMLVLPRRNVAPVRQACARALLAAADAAESRSAGHGVNAEALQQAQDDLQKSYLGNPFRASGLNDRDRSLIVLVGQVQALLAAFARSEVYAMPPCSRPQTRELSSQAATAFRDAAQCLAHPSSSAPSGLAVAEGWQRQWHEAVDVIASDGTDTTDERVDTVFSMFPDRATAIAAVRVIILTRRVLGAPKE